MDNRMCLNGQSSDSRFTVERVPAETLLSTKFTRRPMRGTPSILEGNSLRSTNDSIITINVSGIVFETRRSTLAALPNTLLGNPIRRQSFIDSTSNVIVFDRDPHCFEEIFAYYQCNGESLSKPANVVLIDFLREVLFFDLGPQAVDKVLAEHKSFRLLASNEPIPRYMFKSYFWDLLENPSSGFVAKCYASIRVFIILMLAILATVSSIKYYNSTSSASGIETHIESPVFIIEAILLSLISVDFLLRFVFCPTWKRFFYSLFNIIDAFTVFFFIVIVLTMVLNRNNREGGSFSGIDKTIVNIMLLCQMSQLFKIYKNNSLMRAVLSTLVSQFVDILFVMLIFAIAAICYGYAFYVVEFEDRVESGKISKAIMWAIVTMTTVGYGDVRPETNMGKVVASVCILSSRVLFSMLIPIFGQAYEQYLNGINEAEQFNVLVTKKEDERQKRFESHRSTMTLETTIEMIDNEIEDPK